MLSTSNDEQVGVEDRILDAAASCLLALGVERVTLAAIARRAGVSRPTVYRRWPDSRSVIAALLTARVTDAWAQAPGGSARLDEGESKLGPPHEHGGSARLDEGESKLGPPHEHRGSGRQGLVMRIVEVAGRLRRDEVVMQVLYHAPDLAMVYIAERMGSSQRRLIDVAAVELAAAQADGSVRPGDPRQLAAMCLLITQSAIQSAQLVAPILDEDALDAELAYTLNRYLS